MSKLRATANYIWDIREELGRGATSSVYLAREKRTGKKCAVKTFNSNMRLNPTLLKREIDVLKQLKHPNMVELYTIEAETTTRFDVLVMELCPSGSLLDVLRMPENCYGLQENEMLKLMSHLATGMEYLKKKGISHRDIKPGNIMRSVAKDGTYIYKLTDFGTAKELGDDERFVSLVGTPEYLHPDMYARAFIDRRDKSFTNNVDLWSIGVTLYHAATGMLPFQPLRGREGMDIMHRMTTQKDSGVISGVETSPCNIDWSYKLPETCELSAGLQELLVPMIAGLEECNPRKMWTFDKFFECVRHILNLTSVHVFDVVNWQALRLYLPKSANLSTMMDAVHGQTGHDASDGVLLHHGEHINAKKSSTQTVEMFRPTEPSDPMLLWCASDSEDPAVMVVPEYLQSRKLPPFRSINRDVEEAIDISAVSCAVRRLLAKCGCEMTLVDKAVAMLRSIRRAQSDHLRDRLILLDGYLQSVIKRAVDLGQIHKVFKGYLDAHSASLSEELKLKLQTLQDNINSLQQAKAQLNTEEFQQIASFHKEKDDMSIPWGCEWTNPCKDSPNWAGVAETLESEVLEINKSFGTRFRKSNQPLARIGETDQQIHAFERRSLETLSESVQLTLVECLDKGVGPMLRETRRFYSAAQRAEQELKQQHELCASYKERGTNVETQVDSILNQFLATMNEAMESIKALEDDFAVVGAPENKDFQKKTEDLARLMLSRLAGLLDDMSVTKTQVNQCNMDMRTKLMQPYSLHTAPRGPVDHGALPSILMSLPASTYVEREKKRQQESSQ